MQATVVKVLVGLGDAVIAGDLVCVLEAMKMEQPIKAPKAGIVDSVNVSVGDAVTAGHVLAVVS